MIFLGFIPVAGWAIMSVLWVVELVLWVLLMVKAYQGETFKLPIIGDLAERYI